MNPLVPVALAFIGMFSSIVLWLVREFDGNPSNWALSMAFAVSGALAGVATIMVWQLAIVWLVPSIVLTAVGSVLVGIGIDWDVDAE